MAAEINIKEKPVSQCRFKTVRFILYLSFDLSFLSGFLL